MVTPKIEIVNNVYDMDGEELNPPVEADYGYGPNSYANRYGATKYYVNVGKT